ncbi:MAG TPA: tetratricopeptide repeat protein [Ardenticatenaceae bacterium]|jgi:tetratricopeptide (TPR) repeat protein
MSEPSSTRQEAQGSGIAQNIGSGSATVITNVYQNVRPQPVDEVTKEAARQRLETLPPDTIPDPATLPSGSLMPFSRNPLFVGREQDFLRLAPILKGSETAAIGQIVVVIGLAGIGKTQLASEVVHRYGQYFAGGVFWLSFADPAAIPAEVARCGGAGALDLRPDFGSLPLDDQVDLVLSTWMSDLPRLLIFDNCEDATLLDQWRPRTGLSRVLVTSRNADWSATLGVQSLPLGVLSRDESVDLLRKYRPDLPEDDAALAAIANELGDLPLALHLAGSFLESYQHNPRLGDPDAYLTQLRNINPLEHPSLQGRGATHSPTGHEQHVARTFALSYQGLDDSNPVDVLALKLLARAAYFAPGEPIPHDLLSATIEADATEADERLLIEEALKRLVALGLVGKAKDGDLLLHRLVQYFVLEQSHKAEAQAAVERTLLKRADQLNRQQNPAQLVPWQVHLGVATEMARQRGDEQGAALCHEYGCHLHFLGDSVRGRTYIEQAVAIREAILGPRHPSTAAALDTLGIVLQALGEYPAARTRFEQALAIREQTLGGDHYETVQSLNNLGLLLQRQGEYRAAQQYLERAIKIWKRTLGTTHLDVANALNNLGLVLIKQGDYPGARTCHERALTIREASLGLMHPHIAQSHNNLGTVLNKQGEYAVAQTHFEQALTIYEATLSADHPKTASVLNNLAQSLRRTGDYQQAQHCLERALAIWERTLGPAHPYTGNALNNLGSLFRELGNYEAARSYYDRALAIWKETLGRNHVNTASALHNLGTVFQAQQDWSTAESYYQQAMAIREQMLGLEHPDTVKTSHELASIRSSRKSAT